MVEFVMSDVNTGHNPRGLIWMMRAHRPRAEPREERNSIFLRTENELEKRSFLGTVWARVILDEDVRRSMHVEQNL